MTGMPPEEDGFHVWAEAVGRAAIAPARAAARACRGPLEELVDELLTAPEVARVVDRLLAGPLPEQLVQSVLRNHVLERAVIELVDSGDAERLVAAALDSPRTRDIADAILASDELRRVIRDVASNPALREAVALQGAGLAAQVAAAVRSTAVRVDDRVTRVVRRRVAPETTSFGGLVTRAIALAVDTFATLLVFLVLGGTAALVGSLIGGLRPQWLVGALLASGWLLIATAYFTVCWTTAGQTPGMRLVRVRVRRTDGQSLSLPRSLVRVVGVVLSVIPMFAGFLPVLFTRRRRGFADLLAGTVVVHDVPPDDAPLTPTGMQLVDPNRAAGPAARVD